MHPYRIIKKKRKSAVQISLWDIYNGVSEAIEQHKLELIINFVLRSPLARSFRATILFI